MKKTVWVAIASVIAFSVSFTVFAQEKREMSPEEKAWVEFMTPGWAHEMLAKQAGKWKTETKFWHAPGMPPEVTPGELESEMILGGRYLKSKFTGLAMGQPFEGMSIEGYDNTKKEFTSIWIDSMGTGFSIGHGKISEDKKTITYSGTMPDPLNKVEAEYKSVVTFESDDKHMFEMFGIQDGKEIKMMEMVNTRVK